MQEADVARILLARAIEERHSASVEAALVAAQEAAGDCDTVPSWFLRRASSLLDQLPRRETYRLLLRARDPVEGAAPVVLALGLVVGLVSNEFGPDGKIHLLFNPILGVVAWNLGLYVLLAGRALRRRGTRRLPAAREDTVSSSPPSTPSFRADVAVAWPAGTPWLLRAIATGALGRRWLRWKAWQADARATADEEARMVATLAAFLGHWLHVARKLVVLRVERLFHAGALAFAAGAIAGMYVRGLFLDYDVVWRSTFIRSESTIAFLLNVLLGPAARLLGVDLAAQLDFGGFLSDAGAPAAPWIHLYALTAVLVVVVPRSLLLVWDSLRIRFLSWRLEPDFGEEYFLLRLYRWRETRRQEVVAEIRRAWVAEVGAMAKKVGDFVCSDLYDDAICAELEAFRENGGRLADLEARIRTVSEGFGAKLEAYVQQSQHELEENLAIAVRMTVVKSLGPGLLAGSGLRRPSLEGGPPAQLVGSIGDSLTDTVSLAVSTAVAVALGTVSGGFGKSLGVAVLVGLVHSGPLAFVLGALGGLVAAGAGMWLGRDAISAAVREYRLPAALAKTILWPTRMQKIIDSGREKTRETVSTKVREAMEPMAGSVADEVWRRIDSPRLPETQGRNCVR